MIDGESIRNFRKSNGLTQHEFADKCGLGYLTISRAERGECLTSKTVIAICNAFGIKADILDCFQYESLSGDTIRELRKRKRWTQEQLALECEITQTVISLYESGRVIPKKKTQWKILNALGVSV